MLSLISDWCYQLIRLLERVTAWKNYSLKITLILLVCFNAIYFPEFIRRGITNEWTQSDLAIQQFLNKKIKDPFTSCVSIGGEDHFSKRDLRFTPYLVGNLLRMNAAQLFYIQILSLGVFIFSCLKIFETLTNDRVVSILGTVCLLFCYVGNSFNFDTLFLDSYAYLGILIAIILSESIFCIPVLLLSYFVDERIIIPSLVIPLISYLRFNEIKSLSELSPKGIFLAISKYKSVWYVLGSLCIYAVTRMALFNLFELRTPVGTEQGVGFGVAFNFGEKVLPALWSALKSNLLLIFLGLIYLHKQKLYFIEAWVVIVMLVTLGISLSVEDVTRSFAFSFVPVFVIYQVLNKTETPDKIRPLILVLACINIFTPTYSLILDLVRIKPFGWLF